MGLGHGSGVVGSIQNGSHPVGMGGSLGASPRGSVTVGLLVLEGTLVAFCLSFVPCTLSLVLLALILERFGRKYQGYDHDDEFDDYSAKPILIKYNERALYSDKGGHCDSPGHRGHKNAHLNYFQQELAQVLRNYILLSHQKFPIRSIKVVIRR